MLLYKEGHLKFRNVSIKIPNGFYIKSETDANYENGFELANEDKSVIIFYDFFQCEEGVEKHIKEFVEDAAYTHLKETKKIEHNGLIGYESFYCVNSGVEFYHILFDIGDNYLFDFYIRSSKVKITELLKQKTYQLVIKHIKYVEPYVNVDDRITSLHFNWYNCACIADEDIAEEYLRLDRKKCELYFTQTKANGKSGEHDRRSFRQTDVEEFFKFLEEKTKEWDNDYSVDVCDGSTWRIKLPHSSHRIDIITGSVEYPPNGREIENEIMSLLAKHIIRKNFAIKEIHPKLFGCD